MVSAERQTIMEANRSLRNIKNELENLLEKGIIDESVFDTIHATLPEESPLSGPLRTTANSSNRANAASSSNNPTPAHSTGPTSPPPTQAMQNLGINNRASPSPSPAPPSYNDTPAPSLPSRTPTKPVIAHARALYRYAASDARDLSLERDDKIAVHEYMNDDWWMGQNLRTQKEGIFPRNYIFVESEQPKGPGVIPGPYQAPQQPQYGYPPAQQNPYNSHVPPMAVADGGQQQQQPEQGGEGSGKAGQYGKKFGKKLGNAAIFGAGATIGGNIVNSIF